MVGTQPMVRRRRHLHHLLLALPLLAGPLTSIAYGQTVSAARPVLDRILGVFDRQTGAPLADVEVRDLATGLHARTTRTGTISLARLGVGRGLTLLQIRRLGYRSRLLATSIASDTTPITVVLTPLAVQLPEVVVKGRGAADTVRKLELNGFYDRRRSGYAPSYAYITAADLERWHVTRLGDLYGHIPRDIAKCAIYLDGIVVGGGVILPEEVAALEVYNIAEAPVEYLGTMFQSKPCIALIWTK